MIRASQSRDQFALPRRMHAPGAQWAPEGASKMTFSPLPPLAEQYRHMSPALLMAHIEAAFAALQATDVALAPEVRRAAATGIDMLGAAVVQQTWQTDQAGTRAYLAHRDALLRPAGKAAAPTSPVPASGPARLVVAAL